LLSVIGSTALALAARGQHAPAAAS
jgi:hypothetical protein